MSPAHIALLGNPPSTSTITNPRTLQPSKSRLLALWGTCVSGSTLIVNIFVAIIDNIIDIIIIINLYIIISIYFVIGSNFIINIYTILYPSSNNAYFSTIYLNNASLNRCDGSNQKGMSIWTVT
jgi:hypothetical protein